MKLNSSNYTPNDKTGDFVSFDTPATPVHTVRSDVSMTKKGIRRISFKSVAPYTVKAAAGAIPAEVGESHIQIVFTNTHGETPIQSQTGGVTGLKPVQEQQLSALLAAISKTPSLVAVEYGVSSPLHRGQNGLPALSTELEVGA